VSRPGVDVVVPFRGSAADLAELLANLTRLRLGPGDSLVVVDNTPDREPLDGLPEGAARVVHSAERTTPGFARNRGAREGTAEWLLFLDADVVPPPDLLERFFDPPPGERAGLVAGGVIDEPVPPDAPAMPRYAYIRGAMSQENTFRFGSWGFPQTANVALPRAVFDQVGGFRDDVRAGEDADLTYRLRTAGWEIERREDAAVVHRSRQTVPRFVAQKALHGGGAGWVHANYPDAFPARRRPGLVWWGVRTAVKGLVAAARRRDRDTALWALLEPVEQIAFELGRSLPNERPLRVRSLRRGR
jgi:mycofactocin glycosyltransferase